MADLHITWADIAVAAILILSIWVAIARGFVRETLSIFAWAAAAFATLYFGHYAVAFLAPHMPTLLPEHDAGYVQGRAKGSDSSLYGEKQPADQLDGNQQQTGTPHHKVLHKSYGADDRRALNRLIETTGGGGNDR